MNSDAFLAGLPLRRLVLLVCAGTWVVRALFLAAPDPLNTDELLSLAASEHDVAVQFVAAADWDERWAMLHSDRQMHRHPLWIGMHILWGALLPGNGQMAYALTQLAALIAMLVLAATARRMWGQAGFLLCLLLTSVSPLFLNYAVRAGATMLATMWICIGLMLLAGTGRRLRHWIGGGFCFGLAFLTHSASAPAMLAVWLGVGLSALIRRIRAARNEQALGPAFIGTALGIITMLLPVAIVELGVRSIGGDYLQFLLQRHALLKADYWTGPFGLWLRELFELEPLSQTMLVAAFVGGLWATRGRRPARVALVAAACVVIVLLVIALEQAAPRVFVSLALFGSAGVVLAFACRGNGQTVDAPGPEESRAAAFDGVALAIGLIAVAVVFSIWRPASQMPRLTFPCWPLFVLGITGISLRLWAHRYPLLVRTVAGLGSVVFLAGAAGTFQAKSAASRAHTYSLQHSYMTELRYPADFWSTPSGFEPLRTRARPEIRRFGPAATLYPASCYEELPWMLDRLRSQLERHNLAGVLTAEQLPYAFVFFEAAATDVLPPPGTALVPGVFDIMDGVGRTIASRVHPYRGIAVRFPRGEPGRLRRDLRLELPARSGERGVAGFEYLALSSDAEARLTLSVSVVGQRSATFEVPVNRPDRRAPFDWVALHTSRQRGADPFRLFQVSVTPEGDVLSWRMNATRMDPADAGAAVMLYIRRPFFQPR